MGMRYIAFVALTLRILYLLAYDFLAEQLVKNASVFFLRTVIHN